jgi:hypothetical protein
VLIHLRDQFLALERMASLCTGQLILAEEYDKLASLLPFSASRYMGDSGQAVVFWRPSRRTWRKLVWSAGFERVEQKGTFDMKVKNEFTVPHVVLHGFKA